MTAVTYRREVDGLRAIAVSSVVLYHGELGIAPGGFVGVDVFFVISGYLITSIILSEMQAGRFSFVGFYERRIRRIIPALYLVVACCVPFAWWSMTPNALVDFGQAVVATALFASNILFYFEGREYFAGDPHLNPLLHTWSLAVEEQFYIVFPALMLLLWRLPVKLVGGLLALFLVGGVVLADVLSARDAGFGFFMLPSRAWELCAGVLCALAGTRLHGTGRWLRDTLSLLGLGLILLSIGWFDHETRWPSYGTVLPVAGTVLIILFANGETWCRRLLSLSPVVAVGLLSYSFYLWHQPVFAFYRMRSLTDVSLVEKVALIAVALLLAMLSWRYVERPFRVRSAGQGIAFTPLIGTYAVASLVLLSVGAAGHVFKGFPGRLPADFRDVAYASEDRSPLLETCAIAADAKLPALPVASCYHAAGAQDGAAAAAGVPARIDVALLGDSHAAVLASEVQALLGKAGLSSYAAFYFGCPPVEGIFRVNSPVIHRCPEFNEAVWRFLADKGIRTVVLHARWTYYAQGDYFDNGEGGREGGEPGFMDLATLRTSPGAKSSEERYSRMLSQYRKGIERFLQAGFKVVLVYPVPEAGWHVPRRAAAIYAAHPGEDLRLSTSYERFVVRNARTISALDAIDHPNLVRVRPDKVLCGTFVAGRCALTVGTKVLYFDDDHLSTKGSALVAPEIVAAIRQVVQSSDRRAGDAPAANPQ